MLQVLPRPPGGAGDPGEVAAGLQPQLPGQVMIGIEAGIAGPGLETSPKTLPAAKEALSERLDCLWRQSPPAGGRDLLGGRVGFYIQLDLPAPAPV